MNNNNLAMKKLKKSSFSVIIAVLLMGLAFSPGCGGGRTALMSDTISGVYMTPPPWYPPGFVDVVRTTADFDHVTYYFPAVSQWLLYQGTAKSYWISAIGTVKGLSASMTNPFKEVGVMIIPTDNYSDPGQVTFYLDGVQQGTLDLSASVPFEGYSEEFVSYYQIAADLEEVTHTITMEISTGTVAFDGWRMTYKNQVYNIDCRDVNTLETDTLTETEKLRDGIEDYYASFGAYPNTDNFTDLINYLDSSASIFTEKPENPFTGETMIDSTTFSAGDYHYEFVSDDSYILRAYGGHDTLVSYTEDSAVTDLLKVELTAPENHFATSSTLITFSGNAEVQDLSDFESWGLTNLSISGGVNGTSQFPASGTFSFDLELNEGVNDICIRITDPYAHSISLTRTIEKDTTSPDILLIDPYPLRGPVGSQYLEVTESPVAVRAYVEKNSLATINGVNVTPDSTGVVESSMSLEAYPYENILTITAWDEFNNTNTATYTIYLM